MHYFQCKWYSMTIMKYDLMIFDLDGTILNTLDDLADSCNEILKRNHFPVHTNEEIKYMVGNGIPKLIERALPTAVTKEEYQKVLKEFIDYYETHSAIKTAPYPQMVETLTALKQKGIKLAVNTNKLHEAAVELCKHYFPGIFDVISGGRLGQEPKPAPIGVNFILEKTGIPKNRAVFVGDSDVDIQTGKNSGIDAIGVAWGFRGEAFLREKGATNIVKICTELLSSIE